jgi:FMN-dependent NADH-azoreductase
MTTLLILDASARPQSSASHRFGSHTRRLTAHFLSRWRCRRPQDAVVQRDLGQSPPPPVTGDWIHAAFTPPEQRAPWMHDALALSDRLIDEVMAANVIVAGLPMYNFGPPAQFKAYIDNIVRVGRTFGFDRLRDGEPYWPLLAEQNKTLVLLGSRGDYGYEPGGRIGAMNHVEASVRTAFGYIGITDVHTAAVEYDEFGDERLAQSILQAEAKVDALVDGLLRRRGLAAAA